MHERKTPATALTITLLILAGAAAAADPAPDLSGVWVLNEQASDDPVTALRPANGGSRPGGGMAGPGGGRRGGPGGGMGGRGRGMGNDGGEGGGAPPRERQGADRALALQKRLSRLQIFMAGDEFNLTDGLDISRVLRTDGRTATVWTERGEQQATASWQGGALLVAWTGGRGPGRTTRFELAPEGNQLVVLEQLVRPGEEEPVTLRLVYDRQE